MQACSDLAKLFGSIRRRLITMRRIYNSIPGDGNYHSRIVISHLVIETDNLIKSCLREFSVSSLLGARTRTGQRVKTAATLSTPGEAYAYILSILNTVQYKNKKFPKSISLHDVCTIRNPLDVQKIFNNCTSTNIPSINNALSLNFSLFDDIPTFRNFYAHRNNDTFSRVKKKALDWGIFSFFHADEVVLTVRPGRPVNVFEDWLVDVELFFDVLTQ